MMNSALELHDSNIGNIELQGKDVIVVFSYAYIHQSKGTPGIDAGDEWSQPAKLTIKNSTLPSAIPDNLVDLRGGYLKIADESFVNLIPIPFNMIGPTEFKIFCSEGEEISFMGDGINLLVIGEAKYIEEVPSHLERH